MINSKEILETIRMIQDECLDIRTTTMGISLLDCGDTDIDKSCQKIYDKICKKAEHLVSTGEQIEKEYGIPIINKRVSVTPIAIMAGISGGDPVKYALALEKAAQTIGVNFIGGYSALVQKGFAAGKLVVFCNAPEDNPFMAGAFHGVSEPDCVINVGVSGPGVVRSAVSKHPEYSINEIAELIKKTAFKITRMGQLVGVEASRRLGVDFGIVDLSLAPTPAVGDSVAHILEEIGIEQCGGAGTTACLAMLNDAVKKGGVMASSSVGGLSGAFIPVSEDAGMINAARSGALTIEKLEAMTAVCSVGLDMIVIPGDTTPEVISGIIADEAAIGMVNCKTTAVRVIPAVGKKIGDELEFGGLLGSGPVMKVNTKSPAQFINRGGKIPAPMHSLKN